MRAPGKVLKAEKWWNDKAPPVLGLAYYLVATGTRIPPLSRSAIALLAFIVAFIGVAGYGHVVNDIGDLEVDRLGGKHNTMSGRRPIVIGLMIVVLLGMAWLPWLILPADRRNLALVGIQLLLLTFYAVPPLRLKTRPFSGAFCDALYAYTVPMLITWTTWSQMGGPAQTQTLLAVAMIPWSLCAGLRGILAHQDLDAQEDAAAGITTFVTRYGHARTFWLLSRVILPAEAMCFALMTVAFSLEFPFYPVALLLVCAWQLFQITYLWDVPGGLPGRISAEQAVTFYGSRLLGQFYSAWFPVLMLGALCIRSAPYLILAGMHLAFFETGVMQIIRYDFKSIPWGISKMRRHGA